MSEFRIMLIEDSGLIASDVNQTIKSVGASVDWMFNNAEDALEELESSEPDLIVMDIQLSGEMNGITATNTLVEDDDFNETPVVYLTAYSNKETVERASQSSAFAFLIKPLEENDLKGIIEWIRNDRPPERPSLERGEFF